MQTASVVVWTGPKCAEGLAHAVIRGQFTARRNPRFPPQAPSIAATAGTARRWPGPTPPLQTPRLPPPPAAPLGTPNRHRSAAKIAELIGCLLDLRQMVPRDQLS
jgi:hypothetical protein